MQEELTTRINEINAYIQAQQAAIFLATENIKAAVNQREAFAVALKLIPKETP